MSLLPSLALLALAQTPKTWTTLDDLVAQVAAEAKVPAMSLTVIHRGRMQSAVTGVRERGKPDLVRKGEPWLIGSIGKPVCSTVIARLVEQGTLRWEMTLAEALPRLPMRPEYRAVTLDQLARHRSGLPQDRTFTGLDVMRIAGKETDPIKLRRRYAVDVLGRAPSGQAGEFRYSNAGYTLLGVLAEKATGKPYEELVRSLIYEPLGLRASYATAQPPAVPRPSGHLPTGQVHVSDPTLATILCPAGPSLWMSTEDLARFGVAHLAGLRGRDGLLKAESVKRLHSLTGGDYAAGWVIDTQPGVPTLHWHNGSDGTMLSHLCVFPSLDLVVAAVVNQGPSSDREPGLVAALEIARRFGR